MKQFFLLNLKIDEYEALCDESKFRKATDDKVFFIQDNLHVIVGLPPAIFDKLYPDYPHLFVKSGVVSFSPWCDQVLQGIALDRLELLKVEKLNYFSEIGLHIYFLFLREIWRKETAMFPWTTSAASLRGCISKWPGIIREWSPVNFWIYWFCFRGFIGEIEGYFIPIS